MYGRTRWLILAPLLAIFGLKLATTAYLLWMLLTRATWTPAWKLPTAIGLASLASLQLAILVGIVLRWNAARRCQRALKTSHRRALENQPF